jgi:hypothetical protein
MVEASVHVHEGKIELEIKAEKPVKLRLEPDDAMELGVKLLRAAFAAGAKARTP